MRWQSYWWGTVLLADDDRDLEVLAALKAVLPEKADSHYESGTMETKTGPFVDDHGHSTECKIARVFSR